MIIEVKDYSLIILIGGIMEVINLMKSLSDENRLKIVSLLCEHSETLCSCNLLEELDISQSTLSHHMKILCDCGLVSKQKEGRCHKYYPDHEIIDGLGDFVINFNK